MIVEVTILGPFWTPGTSRIGLVLTGRRFRWILSLTAAPKLAGLSRALSSPRCPRWRSKWVALRGWFISVKLFNLLLVVRRRCQKLNRTCCRLTGVFRLSQWQLESARRLRCDVPTKTGRRPCETPLTRRWASSLNLVRW